MTAVNEKTKKRNSSLILLGAILIWVSMYVYVPILPAYAGQLGASYSTIGLISGVYGVLPIFICIPLGYFSGRMNRDRIFMVSGFALVTLSGAMFWFTNSEIWLIAARAVAAAGSAWWVIISSAYAKYLPEDKEVKGQGVITAGSDVGKMIGCVFCMFLADAAGYKSTFAVATISGAIGMIAMFAIKDAKSSQNAIHTDVTMKSTFQLFKNVDLIKFSILATITQMVSFAIPITFTPIMAQRIYASNMDLSLIQLVYVAVVMVTCLFVGTKPYEKLGGIPSLTISFLLGAVSCVPLFYGNMPMIYLMMVLSGACYGVTLSALAGFVIRAVEPDQRNGAMGVFQTIYSVGVFLGPTLTGGLQATLTLDGGYWVFVGICLLGAILCPLIIPRKYNHMT